MPRDGSGTGDNSIEAGHNIVHGAGKEVLITHSIYHSLLPWLASDVVARYGGLCTNADTA
jgi:hypothetical protein